MLILSLAKSEQNYIFHRKFMSKNLESQKFKFCRTKKCKKLFLHTFQNIANLVPKTQFGHFWVTRLIGTGPSTIYNPTQNSWRARQPCVWCSRTRNNEVIFFFGSVSTARQRKCFGCFSALILKRHDAIYGTCRVMQRTLARTNQEPVIHYALNRVRIFRRGTICRT